MKVLVFAHTPPPHHGQSAMVQILIDGLGGDRRRASGDSQSPAPPIELYHVNARFSTDMTDVGGIRPGKVFSLLKFCFEAVWCRLRYGVETLYYVPAPVKRGAIVRDCVVMLLVRPWFRRLILHGHALGLGFWAAGKVEYPCGPDGPAVPPPTLFGPFEALARALTRFLLGKADLFISLTDYNRKDAELLKPLRIEVVPNGIPDPCPDFETSVLPLRRQRQRERQLATGQANVAHFRAVFLGQCTREKGLFEALEAVARANAELATRLPLRITLSVAGDFVSPAERAEFEARIRQPDLSPSASTSAVTYLGFQAGDKKDRLLRQSDCLLFPTHYPGETFGLVVLEAALYGLPAVVSCWRGVPEVAGTPGAEGVEELAKCLIQTATSHYDPTAIRERALARYGLESHLDLLKKALVSLEAER